MKFQRVIDPSLLPYPTVKIWESWEPSRVRHVWVIAGSPTADEVKLVESGRAVCDEPEANASTVIISKYSEYANFSDLNTEMAYKMANTLNNILEGVEYYGNAEI